VLDMTDDDESTAAAERIARAAIAALDEMRWLDAAQLVHPDTLERFRAMTLDHARAREASRQHAAEVSWPDDMPPEVVAWHEAQRQRAEDEGRLIRVVDPGLAPLGELEALTAEELFARHIESRDVRAQMLHAAAAQGRELPPDAPHMTEPWVRRTIVGSVADGGDEVHVLYRARQAESRTGSTVLAMTLRRAAGGWRIWSATQDPALFNDGTMLHSDLVAFVETEEETAARLRELAQRSITWRTDSGSGRAYFIAEDPCPGRAAPAITSLIIGWTDANGDTTTTPIPADVFADLGDALLQVPPQAAP
jgi:hypothetical protein